MTTNTVPTSDPRRPTINHLSKLCWGLEGKVLSDPALRDLSEIVKRMRGLVEELLDESSPVSADRRS